MPEVRQHDDCEVSPRYFEPHARIVLSFRRCFDDAWQARLSKLFRTKPIFEIVEEKLFMALLTFVLILVITTGIGIWVIHTH